MKNIHTKTKDEVLKQFNIDQEKGLTPERVDENRERFGVNSFGESKKDSLIKRVWDAATEPMIIILIVAAFITLGVNITRFVQYGQADFIECVGIFVAIALSVVITVITEGRSAKAFEALNKINEDTLVKVVRDGTPQMIPQKEVVVGDILIVETGDKLVADGRVLSSVNLRVNESSLTGESDTVLKDADFVAEEKTPVADRKNMIYSGCFVTEGRGVMIVTSVGKNTEFGKIADELSTIDKSQTPLQEKLARLGKTITILGAAAAALVFTIQLIQFTQLHTLAFDNIAVAFISSIVLIVAAVPEGLPTIVAVSLALNIIKMTRENALVKKMVACETIGCVNVICSDKTGTITENKMTVQQIYVNQSLIEPDELKDEYLINNFCINSSANIHEEDGKEVFVGNPTECSLLVSANKSGIDYESIRKGADVVRTFPFSSQRKNMTTVVKEDDSYTIYTKGNPEKILSFCSDLNEEEKKDILNKMIEFQNQAKRLIAFAHKRVDSYNNEKQDEIECDMSFDGFVVISDPISEDVYGSVAQCKKAGIEVKMLTGDNIVTATAIARELSIVGEDDILVEAPKLDDMTDEELKKALPKIRVIARSTPMIKMRVVTLLKEMDDVVAVTGDGINDAPAIKHADVGISMGVAGTEVTKEASDIVLLDDSFTTIVKAVKWGRGIYENFKRFIQFQLTVNVASATVIIISVLVGKASPFTALQILWINLIMDGPPALTLGLEPMRGNLLNRKPTDRNENIISKKMFGKILFNGIWVTAIVMIQSFTNFMGAKSDTEMSTVIFTMFVIFQLFNAFNCRELDDTPMYKNLLKNKLMLGVFLIVLIIQIVITQFATVVFNTVPLSLEMWGKIFTIAFSIIVINEVVKFLKRLYNRFVSK